MLLIDTDAYIDPISFIICLITPTSIILIISPMITFISTVLIISLMIISTSTILATSLTISISTILIISLIVISISTLLTISMIISFSTILIISLMIIHPPLAVRLGSFGLGNTEGFLFCSDSSLSPFIVWYTFSLEWLISDTVVVLTFCFNLKLYSFFGWCFFILGNVPWLSKM